MASLTINCTAAAPKSVVRAKATQPKQRTNAPAVTPKAPAVEQKERFSFGQKALSFAAAGILLASPPAFAADKAALSEKGRVFAEASADVLRSAGKDNVIGAVRAATEVAISVDPLKALAAVDAGLEALETASTADLINVVKAAEHATTVSLDQKLLIPPNDEIDKVVDAAAAAAGGVNAAALSKFAGAAQDAALSADAKKLGGLTGVGVKIGLSVGPGKIAAATKAATDLLLAL